MARDLLRAAVRAGAEDQLRRPGDGHPAVHRARASGGRHRAGRAVAEALRAAAAGRPVPEHLRQFAEDGGLVDADVPAGRVSDRLLHRARDAGSPQPADDGRDAAVLDVVPDPRLRVGRHHEGRRAAEPRAGGARRDRDTAAPLSHRRGRLHRDGLFVPAVHGDAAVRAPREDGSHAARGGERSRRNAVVRVLAHHAAVVAQRHRCGQPAGVHSGGRRIRDPRTARGREHADARPRDVGRVLQQHGLVDGVRRDGDDGAAAARADGAAPLQPDRSGGKTMTRANRILSACVLGAGFLFLYVPIVSLVAYSFNASKLVTVWSGFSLKWYGSAAARRRAADGRVAVAEDRAADGHRVSRDRHLGRFRAREDGALSRLHAVCRDDQCAARDSGSDPGHLAATAVRRDAAGVRLAGRARLADDLDRPRDAVPVVRRGDRAVAREGARSLDRGGRA
ncbi:hypothetical protein BCEP4_1310003 [Burkholderia cepacia]|nr:hypothetical protein BCEP4_1310003 [Burkholderia cepacia]